MTEFEKAARLMNETGQGEHLGVKVGVMRRRGDGHKCFWDDDAICEFCGFDGAEEWHLSGLFCGNGCGNDAETVMSESGECPGRESNSHDRSHGILSPGAI